MAMFRNLFAYLPEQWQIILKQLVFAWKIKTGRFVTDEPEFGYIESIVSAGDTVIDIGANVGVYTRKFSELVGPSGRVYAFEPVPETFYLLAAHTSFCNCRNLTLVNMAVSDKIGITTMTIPRSGNHLRNYYRATVTAPELVVDTDSIDVFCYPLDQFHLSAQIRLVKIDVEGHEVAVLSGMRDLIKRDKPVLIIESVLPGISEWLSSQGYRATNLPGSPNTVFECTNA